ncbi:hypothetical protein [Limosilactobacillus ingluviei]|uniref:hypothetical protein n=1 Tax=Limosilactobacillus ingluviei TaxID=148604 RepID=UPI0024B8D3E5|nr:hypothetical protein [Limosilactobacillus ingluviei]
MMKQAKYVKETIDYLQNDLEEQGVDITLQKDTKGMPKSKKHYKHVKVTLAAFPMIPPASTPTNKSKIKPRI